MNGKLLNAMLVFATNKHNGQFDKAGKPYILHPLAVMSLLDSEDEELQCIAIGHDVIEDTDATFQDLVNIGMTDRVVSGIKCLTKMPGQTYEEYKAGVFSNRDAMQVKMADLRHNSDITRMKGITQKDIDRTVKYQRFYMEIQQRFNTNIELTSVDAPVQEKPYFKDGEHVYYI